MMSGPVGQAATTLQLLGVPASRLEPSKVSRSLRQLLGSMDTGMNPATKESRRRLEDLIGTAQLGVLLLQPPLHRQPGQARLTGLACPGGCCCLQDALLAGPVDDLLAAGLDEADR
jgi:hypothetical protein